LGKSLAGNLAISPEKRKPRPIKRALAAMKRDGCRIYAIAPLCSCNNRGADIMDLKTVIRSIPDFPKPGILYRDITTLLTDARGFRRAVDELVQPLAGAKIDKVAGIEARGFILGGAIAHQLSVGFVPIRKKGKLPHKTISQTYELEYGSDDIEIHVDAIETGERVLLVDDLIATGGTAMAAIQLLERAGAEIVLCTFVVDLPDLGGADRLRADGKQVTSLVQFDGE
jgi:adenine phosphoribosyltransferase